MHCPISIYVQIKPCHQPIPIYAYVYLNGNAAYYWHFNQFYYRGRLSAWIFLVIEQTCARNKLNFHCYMCCVMIPFHKFTIVTDSIAISAFEQITQIHEWYTVHTRVVFVTFDLVLIGIDELLLFYYSIFLCFCCSGCKKNKAHIYVEYGKMKRLAAFNGIFPLKFHIFIYMVHYLTRDDDCRAAWRNQLDFVPCAMPLACSTS